jgi:predicted nuclease of predicted toxin-antitoxin system
MASRFKLDENLPRHAHALLVSEGHEAHTVNDEQLEGCPDDRILDACKNEDRILVTLDLDFADIRRYPPSTHQGIWVLRPQTQSIENVLAVIRGELALLGHEQATNRLWIVESTSVRIRE